MSWIHQILVKESYWHTGMLDSSAWHAQWIGTPNEEFQSVEVMIQRKIALFKYSEFFLSIFT